MILEKISLTEKVGEKKKEITITNNGVTYKITSDFLGLRITNDHSKGITIYAAGETNQIIIR